MHRTIHLQLATWREACRHIDLGESLPDLLAAIRPFVSIGGMWVFSVDGTRCELVAACPASVGVGPGRVIDGADTVPIERFARRGGLCRMHPVRPGRSALRALGPLLGPAPVICGALRHESGTLGVVVWRMEHGAESDDEATAMLASILEPIAVALDTSSRFHELEELRRAAEADRQTALRRLGRETLDEPIVGAGTGLRGVMDRVDIVAGSEVPVLILGETGSGKEVVARSIHLKSRRHEGPFLRVNCGAIPPELIDSQLFGHERGAFTGATDQRLGWFERADGGTLFLDEVGELPAAAQVRLLRVLQDGTLERVGGQTSIKVDCRIVAATHRDLAEMVRTRTFREDLWYRLAVFPLVLPPLRERLDDLPALVEHFAHRATLRFGLPEFTIDRADLELLRSYHWPGNIRELAAVIDRAALLGRGHRLAISAAMGVMSPGTPQGLSKSAEAIPSSAATLDAAIRGVIESALRTCRGKVEGPGGAAEMLAVNPQTLRSKMRKLGVDGRRFRPTGTPECRAMN